MQNYSAKIPLIHSKSMFLSYRHIETSQFICIANQLTGFCMTETLPINE